MLVEILFEGIISYAIPESIIQNYLGGGFRSIFIMLLVGIHLYICATILTPLTASLIAKGMSPGAAFVSLIAGPATNAATTIWLLVFWESVLQPFGKDLSLPLGRSSTGLDLSENGDQRK